MISRIHLRRKSFLFFVVGLILLAGIVMLLGQRSHETRLIVGGRTFMLQVADTDKTRAQGLSGQVSLTPNNGMLFVFQDASSTCFWMRDMRFPLDIIWFGPQKRVVHIQPDVSPKTYPHQFCPSQSAQYVIELHADMAQSVGLHVGQTLHF